MIKASISGRVVVSPDVFKKCRNNDNSSHKKKALDRLQLASNNSFISENEVKIYRSEYRSIINNRLILSYVVNDPKPSFNGLSCYNQKSNFLIGNYGTDKYQVNYFFNRSLKLKKPYARKNNISELGTVLSAANKNRISNLCNYLFRINSNNLQFVTFTLPTSKQKINDVEVFRDDIIKDIQAAARMKDLTDIFFSNKEYIEKDQQLMKLMTAKKESLTTKKK